MDESVNNGELREAEKLALGVPCASASRRKSVEVDSLGVYTRQISTDSAQFRFEKTTEFSDVKEIASTRLRNFLENIDLAKTQQSL
ncbi:hypothetical protein K0M31_007173 [Melipona bicolor]|uniref:Uncharacterized protein n=1 Tax=Melipona bicolor TaxID=60889 RepID=A0AA40KKX5_9HYME|nr:hypothetical protein K0M31_007173 [Melipona bicolor]